MATHFYLPDSASPTITPLTAAEGLNSEKNGHMSKSLKQRKSPVEHSTRSSALSMRLPVGYTTDHWAWSMSDPSFRSSESTTLPWDELDDLFLFPKASVEDHELMQAESRSDFDEDEDKKSRSSNSSGTVSPGSFSSISTTSNTGARKATKTITTSQNGPMPLRATSHTAPLPAKSTSDAKRSNSITVSMIKTVRNTRSQQQKQRAQEAQVKRKVSELAVLRRQVADLTQRLTLLMANQCAACRLGLIDCGLNNERDDVGADLEAEETKARPPVDDQDLNWNRADGRNVARKLARQAELLAF